MRILFLVYSPQDSLQLFGSNFKTNFPWVDTLLEELIKRNIFTMALAVPIRNIELQKAKKNGIMLYGLPNPDKKSPLKKIWHRINHSPEDPKINIFVNETVLDFQPDLIHIFGTENPFGLVSLQVKIPVVIHIQGSLLVVAQKWFAGLSRWDQLKFASKLDLFLMRSCYSEFITIKNRALREEMIVQNCKYFMGRTGFDKDLISLLSPGSRHFHCEELIRKNFFEKQWSYIRNDKISCVSILNGSTYKGVELLIETSLLLEKYSSMSYEFKICGVSGQDRYIKMLKKKFKKEMVFSRFRFLGKLDEENLISEICNSSLYIHPSHVDNSPNSVCEAMVLGIPIIATCVGGLSSLIENNVDGILVQEGEPYMLAGAIVELSNNHVRAKYLGNNARRKAIVRHDPGSLIRNLTGVYNTVLSQSKNL